MGGVLTVVLSKLGFEQDESDPKVLSAGKIKKLTERTTCKYFYYRKKDLIKSIVTASELKHWFGLFIANYPDGHIRRENFYKEFDDFFPHGDASKISSYLFQIFDNCKKVEHDEQPADDKAEHVEESDTVMFQIFRLNDVSQVFEGFE